MLRKVDGGGVRMERRKKRGRAVKQVGGEREQKKENDLVKHLTFCL